MALLSHIISCLLGNVLLFAAVSRWDGDHHSEFNVEVNNDEFSCYLVKITLRICEISQAYKCFQKLLCKYIRNHRSLMEDHECKKKRTK